MRKQSSLLSKILPPSSDNILSGADLDRGYKKFSRGLCIILMVLVLVPLTIISLLAHYQYRQLLQQDEQDQILLHLDQTTSTIEKFVSELQTVVRLVAQEDSYKDLIKPKELKALYYRLRNEYTHFADIEVIDADGMQKNYVGPYQLAGHSYSDQTWYKEVLLHGVYMSSVFSGFRNVPHFVIAVSRKLPDNLGSWVLRVTIDGKTLQDFVDTISTTYADDIFLVDASCVPQTQPQKFGNIGEKCVLPKIEDTAEKKFIQSMAKRNVGFDKIAGMRIVQHEFKGQQIIQAVVKLENTPWRLVLVKEQYLYGNIWRLFKIKLITIFLSCAIVAVFIILEISKAITDHIHEADLKREQFLVEAEQPNKLASIGRLAAGVAHEINNPLAVINQKTGLVQDFMEMSEEFKHKEMMEGALDGIQDSVERCKKITHRLLGFARQAEVKTEELDVNVVVCEVVDFLAKEASYNQIVVDCSIDENISHIISDRGQLLQIFINISNNAVDAIGSGGNVTLSSSQPDPENIRINIADDGPGMSAEIQQHIFDPFFTTKETGKGTGLGLAITYGLIKKLGGKINVVSEVGKGTTFEIDLPLEQEPTEEEE